VTARGEHAKYLNWCLFSNVIQIEWRVLLVIASIAALIYHTFWREWDMFTPLAWWSLAYVAYQLWAEIIHHHDALKYYVKHYTFYLDSIPT